MQNVAKGPAAVTNINKKIGGRGGIRTHGTLAGTPVFKTGALNHSATLPDFGIIQLFVAWQNK